MPSTAVSQNDSNAPPSSVKEWDAEIQRARNGTRIKNGGLHAIVMRAEEEHKLISGSKMSRDDFLALRVLWRMHSGRALAKDAIFRMAKGRDALQRARTILDGSEAWKKYYTEHLHDDNTWDRPYRAFGSGWSIVDHSLRILSRLRDMPAEAISETSNIQVRRSERIRIMNHQREMEEMRSNFQQMAVTEAEQAARGGHAHGLSSSSIPTISSGMDSQGPLDPKLYPLSTDEMIVNAALVNFLQVLTIGVDQVKATWTIDRKQLHLGDVLEARTDGYLHYATPDRDIAALIECKAKVRRGCTPEVQYQESAQMAAFVLTYPGNGNIRIEGWADDDGDDSDKGAVASSSTKGSLQSRSQGGSNNISTGSSKGLSRETFQAGSEGKSKSQPQNGMKDSAKARSSNSSGTRGVDETNGRGNDGGTSNCDSEDDEDDDTSSDSEDAMVDTVSLRRISIAMSQHEIYINVAVYGEQYRQFLERTSNPDGKFNPFPVTEESFMTMHSYGPYIMNNIGSIKTAARLLLALTIMFSEQSPTGSVAA